MSVKPIAKPNLKPEPLGMVGRCFIIWGEINWKHQGVIRGEPAPGQYLCQYLCQFSDCIMGDPSDLTVFPLERFVSRPWREPGSAILFEDDKHLRFWIEHRAPPVTHADEQQAMKDADEAWRELMAKRSCENDVHRN